MGRKRSSLIGCLAAIAAVAALATPGSAFASATIGTNLGNLANSNLNGCNNACTAVNRLLLSDSAPQGLTSPVNGTVTSWRFNDSALGNQVNLRVLRQVSNGVFTGISTSSTQTSGAGNANGPFATSLPIKAGDYVGLQAGAGGASFLNNTTPADFLDMYWAPPLADGETLSGVGSNDEVMVQATVVPTNTVTFGGVVRNKKKGTAVLTVNVPNPGQLGFSVAGGKIARTANSGTTTVAAPGPVKFLIKATGKKRKKLNSKGKVKLSATFTFTPSFGTSSTQSTKVKLKKKHK